MVGTVSYAVNFCMTRVTIGDDSLQKLSFVLFFSQSWLNMAALKF